MVGNSGAQCARKEQSLSYDLLKALDGIESNQLSDFFQQRSVFATTKNIVLESIDTQGNKSKINVVNG